MKDQNHHKEEVIAKVKAKIEHLQSVLSKLESGEIQASVEPLGVGKCPIGWYYDGDCGCCLYDAG